MSRRKFNLLLLEEGEYLLDEYAALMITCSAAPEGGSSGEPFTPDVKLRGTLRICTRSLCFESEDIRQPVVRMPFAAMVTGAGKPTAMSSWPSSVACGALHRMLLAESLGAADAFVLQTKEQVEMKAGNVIGPYRTRTFPSTAPQTTLFALLNMTAKDVLPLVQQLFTIQTSKTAGGSLPPGYERMAIESLLAPRRDGPFNLSLLLDFRERPRLPAAPVAISVERVFPLVTVPGRVMITERGLYVQPTALQNVAGSDPVTFFPLRDIRRVMRRRRLQREVALELFLSEDSPLAAPGAVSPEASAAGLKPSSPNTNLSTLGGLPSFSGQSVYFVFLTPDDRNRVYRELLGLLRETRKGSAAPPTPTAVTAGDGSAGDSSSAASLQSSSASSSSSSSLFDDDLGDPSPGLIIRTTRLWQLGQVSNYDYLLFLNCLANRSLADLTQFPVFPWVLADYTSSTLDLTNPATFRDLSKPVGALNAARLARVQERFKEMPRGPGCEPPFLWGTHYSAAGYCLYFLVRAMPEQMLRLQSGAFDVADRLFSSVQECWQGVTSLNMDVKELIPHFFSGDGASFLLAPEGLDLGVRQNGRRVGDVTLPPWSYGDPATFVQMNREALECDWVSNRLHSWIDLIFGHKQRGIHAETASNVFFHLTYDSSDDSPSSSNADALALTADPERRMALQQQMQEFGQTPRQLFKSPHPQRSGPQIPTQLLLAGVAGGAAAMTSEGSAVSAGAAADAGVAGEGKEGKKKAGESSTKRGDGDGEQRVNRQSAAATAQHHHHHQQRNSRVSMANKRRSVAMAGGVAQGGAGGAGSGDDAALIGISGISGSRRAARRSTVRSVRSSLGDGGRGQGQGQGQGFAARLPSSASSFFFGGASSAASSFFLMTRDQLFFSLEALMHAANSNENSNNDAEGISEEELAVHRHPSVDFSSLPFALEDEEWREVEWVPARIVAGGTSSSSSSLSSSSSVLSALSLAVTSRDDKRTQRARLCLISGSTAGELTVTKPLDIEVLGCDETTDVGNTSVTDGSTTDSSSGGGGDKTSIVLAKAISSSPLTLTDEEREQEQAARFSPFFLLQEAVAAPSALSITAVAPINLHLRTTTTASSSSSSIAVDGSRVVLAASLDGCAYLVDTANNTVLRKLVCSSNGGVTCLEAVPVFMIDHHHHHQQTVGTSSSPSASSPVASWIIVVAAGCSDNSISLQTVVLTQWAAAEEDDASSPSSTSSSPSSFFFFTVDADSNPDLRIKEHGAPVTAISHRLGHPSAVATGAGAGGSSSAGPSVVHFASGDASGTLLWFSAAVVAQDTAASAIGSSPSPSFQLSPAMPRPPSVQRLIVECALLGSCETAGIKVLPPPETGTAASNSSSSASSPSSLLNPASTASLLPLPTSLASGVTALSWAPPMLLPVPVTAADKEEGEDDGAYGANTAATKLGQSKNGKAKQPQHQAFMDSFQALLFAATSDGQLAVVQADFTATTTGTAAAPAGLSSSADEKAASTRRDTSAAKGVGLGDDGTSKGSSAAPPSPSSRLQVQGLIATGSRIVRALAVSHDGGCVAIGGHGGGDVRLLDVAGFLEKMTKGPSAAGAGASFAEKEDWCQDVYWTKAVANNSNGSGASAGGKKQEGSSGEDGDAASAGSGSGSNRRRGSRGRGEDGFPLPLTDLLIASASDCVVATLSHGHGGPGSSPGHAQGSTTTTTAVTRRFASEVERGERSVRYSGDLCSPSFLSLVKSRGGTTEAGREAEAASSLSSSSLVTVTSLAFVPCPASQNNKRVGSDATSSSPGGDSHEAGKGDDEHDEAVATTIDSNHLYLLAVGLKRKAAAVADGGSPSAFVSEVSLWAGLGASQTLARIEEAAKEQEAAASSSSSSIEEEAAEGGGSGNDVDSSSEMPPPTMEVSLADLLASTAAAATEGEGAGEEEGKGTKDDSWQSVPLSPSSTTRD